LPLFDVGDSPIDPYGLTVLRGQELRRLHAHLSVHLVDLVARPETSTVTDASDRTLRIERAKTLEVVEKTVKMIEYALANGYVLAFRGD